MAAPVVGLIPASTAASACAVSVARELASRNGLSRRGRSYSASIVEPVKNAGPEPPRPTLSRRTYFASTNGLNASETSKWPIRFAE